MNELIYFTVKDRLLQQKIYLGDQKLLLIKYQAADNMIGANSRQAVVDRTEDEIAFLTKLSLLLT